MPKLLVVVGLSCTGKSTYIKEYLEKHYGSNHSWQVLSASDISIGGGIHKRNKTVWRAMFPSVPHGFSSFATPFSEQNAVSIPTKEELLKEGVCRNVVVDAENGVASERKSLFSFLLRQIRLFPSSNVTSETPEIEFTVIFLDDTRNRAKPTFLGKPRLVLFGYRMADDCLRMINHAPLKSPSETQRHRSLFVAPQTISVDPPSKDEGMNVFLHVSIQDMLADDAERRRISDTVRRECLSNPELKPSQILMNCSFFSSKSRSQALFVPVRLLVKFVASGKRPHLLRPVLSTELMKAMWMWACGGNDNRRVIILSGAFERVETASSNAEDSQKTISHELVDSLFESLRLPLPIFSFSTRISRNRSVSTEREASLSLSSGGQVSDFLPIDTCGIAYLERLLNLNISSSFGLTQSIENMPSNLSLPFVSLTDFLISLKTCELFDRFWVDWTTHPCFSDGRRGMRSGGFVEHPFGNMLSSKIQYHGGAMPSLYSISRSSIANRLSLDQSIASTTNNTTSNDSHREPSIVNLSGTLVHKSGYGGSLAPLRSSGQYSDHPNDVTSTQSPSAFNLGPRPNYGEVADGVPFRPSFVCSQSSVSVFFGHSALENGIAYSNAGQVCEESVQLSFGLPLPYGKLEITEEGDAVWDVKEPCTMATATVQVDVWSSDRSRQYGCLLFFSAGSVVGAFCSCGTATTAYGGNHCRHCSAVAVLLSQKPRTAFEKPAILKPNLKKEGDNSLDLLGAADRSSYTPKEMTTLHEGIPLTLLNHKPNVSAATRGTAPKTTALRVLGSHGIPSKKIPLGPNAPQRRPLTPYFWFMKNSVARSNHKSNEKDVADGENQSAMLLLRSTFLPSAHTGDFVESEPPKPQKMRVTEATRALAQKWHSLDADEKAKMVKACEAFNAEVLAEWAAYITTDECKNAIQAFSSRQSLELACPKEDSAHAAAVEETPTPISAPTAYQSSFAGIQWRMDEKGNWVYELHPDDETTDEDDSAGDSSVCPKGNQPKLPVLGSLFEERFEGVNAHSSELGALTRGSTVAQMRDEYQY